jgi:hypothetical protein
MEFVTIPTLNEILLPPFLFLVVFCFLCCHLPRQSYTCVTPQQPEAEDGAIAIPKPQSETVKEILPLQEPAPATALAVEEPATSEPNTPAVENVPVEKEADKTVTSAEPISSQQTELYAQALTVIDNLGKREARKLMGSLKLQQKRNGVELSTELMIASIRRKFKVDPERVIGVMSDRLPELVPATADRIQLAN